MLLRYDRAIQLLAGCAMALNLFAAQQDHALSPALFRNNLTGGASLPDVELVNQDGHRVHVYSDLIKGKVVAINSIFTTCTTICPTMGAGFARLERLLGDNPDTMLISISVDPSHDTPEMLKAWSAKFHRGPGWTLLTGPKPDVDRLLKALGLQSADKDAHSPMTVIGSDRSWTRQAGLPSPAKLAGIMNEQRAALAGEAK